MEEKKTIYDLKVDKRVSKFNKGQKLTPEQSEKVKRGIKGIKEKIAPKKKMDRLEELRKELK